jgi:hypothetical protein
MNQPRMPKLQSLLVALSMIVVVLGTGAARADDPKPKPKSDTPTESLSLNFTRIEFSTKTIDGSPGQTVVLDGLLHLVSQTLLSDDGVPTGFTLHANLAKAFSAEVGGSFVAVGSSEGIPDECLQSAACPPPSWTFTFRLIPRGAGSRPSLLFDLTVRTQYDADGKLTNACIAGQEGCEDGEFLQ